MYSTTFVVGQLYVTRDGVEFDTFWTKLNRPGGKQKLDPGALLKCTRVDNPFRGAEREEDHIEVTFVVLSVGRLQMADISRGDILTVATFLLARKLEPLDMSIVAGLIPGSKFVAESPLDTRIEGTRESEDTWATIGATAILRCIESGTEANDVPYAKFCIESLPRSQEGVQTGDQVRLIGAEINKLREL